MSLRTTTASLTGILMSQRTPDHLINPWLLFKLSGYPFSETVFFLFRYLFQTDSTLRADGGLSCSIGHLPHSSASPVEFQWVGPRALSETERSEAVISLSKYLIYQFTYNCVELIFLRRSLFHRPMCVRGQKR